MTPTARMTRDHDWDDDNVHPTKGPKGDTAFLKENYRLLGPGGVFRTPKARFTPRQIRLGAEKAGFTVKIEDQFPWLRVTITGRIRSNANKSPTKVTTSKPPARAAKKQNNSDKPIDIFS